MGFYRLSILTIALALIVCSATKAVDLPLLYDEDSAPFTGIAKMKALIVSDGVTIWSHDGTSIAGQQPRTSFPVAAKEGVISLDLGSEYMRPIFAGLFDLYPDAELKLWADIGEGFRLFASRPITAESLVAISEQTPRSVEDTGGDVTNWPPPLIQSPEVIDEELVREQAEREEFEYPENPDARAQQRFLQRADDDGKIDMNALLRAKEHIDEMRARNSDRDGGIWGWEWLGPGNIGGRIRAIVIHPTQTNRMWIGSVAGGIWRSLDGGASWSPVNDFLPNLSISQIVLDPTNPNIMYASTGEGFGNSDALPGAGIFKSTDGGDHWSQLPATANVNFEWVNDLAHHPLHSDTIYAVTGKTLGNIYRSTNGGTTWTSLESLSTRGTDVKVSREDSQRILVGCNNDVYYSFNGGWSFTNETTGATDKLPNDPGRCEVAFGTINDDVFYVAMERNGGELWRSTNSGTTWELRCGDVDFYVGASNQGSYDNILWVDPTNQQNIVIGGIDSWRSTDGGQTFSKISMWEMYHMGFSAHCDFHAIVNHPNFDGENNTTVYVGNDGGIQKTDNIYTVAELLGWENLAHNLGITQFYGGAASPGGGWIIGGTQDNSVLRYRPEDGVQGWHQAITGDAGFCTINHETFPYITLLSELPNLVILKSQFNGDAYLPATNGLGDADDSDKTLFISPFVMAPQAPNVLYAGGTSIWRTNNTADEWYSVRDPLSDSAKCSAIDVLWEGNGPVWVGYEDGHVAKSTNGGTSWTRVDNNGVGLPNRYVTDIAINSVFPDRVFVTFSRYLSNNVWLTTDGGQTWLQRTGTAPDTLPAIQVNTVRWYPTGASRVYIGTDLGVFASDDLGVTWSTAHAYPDNEGPVNTEVSELFWQGDKYLLAATHGRGMYRCEPHLVLYVDANAAPGGDGTSAHPFQTVSQAVSVAGHGTNIFIQAGTYQDSPIILDKKGKIEATGGKVIIE